jgi:hypothetical protein
VQPGGAAPGTLLPERCEGYHSGNDRPVRGGPAALTAARRAREHAVTREPAAGTSYLLCTNLTGCAGLSRTPLGGKPSWSCAQPPSCPQDQFVFEPSKTISSELTVCHKANRPSNPTLQAPPKLDLAPAVLQNQRGRQPDGERELREGPPLGGPSKLSADVSFTWRRPRGLRQGCTYPG